MFPLRCARAHRWWDERTQENVERPPKGKLRSPRPIPHSKTDNQTPDAVTPITCHEYIIPVASIPKAMMHTAYSPKRRQSGLKSGGSWIWVKNVDFPCNFQKKISCKFHEKFRFIHAISQQHFDFSRQIYEKFRLLRQFHKRFRFSRRRLATFEHYFLYMIRYIPGLPQPPCTKSGGRDPQPPGLTSLYFPISAKFINFPRF